MRRVAILALVSMSTALPGAEAKAGSIHSNYDMNRFLSEPHPFATARRSAPAAPAPRPATVAPAPRPVPVATPARPAPRTVADTRSTAPAPAPAPKPKATAGKAKPDTGVWRFETQNEDSGLFNPIFDYVSENKDGGHLTWGWRISYTPDATNPEWVDGIRDYFDIWPRNDYTARVSYSLQQSAYTPQSQIFDARGVDRPHAGFLLFNARVNLEQDFEGNGQVMDQLNLGVGLVGPASGANVIHRVAHSIAGHGSRGWEEIKSEPVVVAHYETGIRWVFGDDDDWVNFEAHPHIGAAVGNAYIYGHTGFNLRIGNHLRMDSGAPRQRLIASGTNFPRHGDYWSWNIFAGVDGRAVGHNIFINGNTYTDTTDITARPWVYDLQAGFELGYGAYRLTLMNFYRSKEFQQQHHGDQVLRLGLSAHF